MKINRMTWIVNLAFLVVIMVTKLVTPDTLWICLFIALLGIQLLDQKVQP